MSRGTSKVGPSAERFHKLAHVSEQIDRSVRDLYRDIAAGKLIVHRFGRAVRVAEGDLARYLAAHRCEPKK